MEKQYTVLEAAQAAGISKNKAKYRLSKCPVGEITKTSDGILMVSESAVQWLIDTVKADQTQQEPDTEAVDSNSKSSCSTSESLLKTTIEVLQDQLNQKDKQIDRLQDQLDSVTQALKAAQEQAGAAQALHAGTIQQRFIESEAEAQEPDKPGRSFWSRLWNK